MAGEVPQCGSVPFLALETITHRLLLGSRLGGMGTTAGFDLVQATVVEKKKEEEKASGRRSVSVNFSSHGITIVF